MKNTPSSLEQQTICSELGGSDLVFWPFGFFYPELLVINSDDLDFNHVFGASYYCAELGRQFGFCKKRHSRLLQLFSYALGFLVRVAAVLYAFPFNDRVVEVVLAALNQLGAVSDEPEWRSFSHNYRQQ